jgi:stage V sporulation protein B
VNFLVAVPSLNINGAPIGTNLCYMTIMVLNMIVIARSVAQAPNLISIFARPLGATLVMAAAAWASYGLLSRVMSGRLVTLIAIAIAGGIYLIMVLLMRCITRDELSMFPKGDKIAAILRIK